MDDRVHPPACLLDGLRVAEIPLDTGKPISGVRQFEVCHVTALQ